jgi:hypothetical protein
LHGMNYHYHKDLLVFTVTSPWLAVWAMALPRSRRYAPDMYSGDARFESRLEHRLSWGSRGFTQSLHENHSKNGKAIHVIGHTGPLDCETLRLQSFSWESAHRWRQGYQTYVFVSVRGWVDPRAIVRLEGLGQFKNPSGIEPATFRLLA